MNNFTHVQIGALHFRLIPRLLSLFIIMALLAIGASIGLSYLHFNQYVGYTILGAIIIFVLIGLIIYLSAYLEYTNLQYLIEENSLYLKEGVLSVDTETIPFQKIRNAQFTQTFLQRLYGVGNIIIDQDPETYTWESIDQKTSQAILEAVSQKSNIQPIAVATNNLIN